MYLSAVQAAIRLGEIVEPIFSSKEFSVKCSSVVCNSPSEVSAVIESQHKETIFALEEISRHLHDSAYLSNISKTFSAKVLFSISVLHRLAYQAFLNMEENEQLSVPSEDSQFFLYVFNHLASKQ